MMTHIAPTTICRNISTAGSYRLKAKDAQGQQHHEKLHEESVTDLPIEELQKFAQTMNTLMLQSAIFETSIGKRGMTRNQEPETGTPRNRSDQNP